VIGGAIRARTLDPLIEVRCLALAKPAEIITVLPVMRHAPSVAAQRLILLRNTHPVTPQRYRFFVSGPFPAWEGRQILRISRRCSLTGGFN
jgi:hypothetical protein